ncbi:prolyl oligopeptidase family serine peptidase [Christiangramia aquimixticola]|uniref:carboxylesterase family protein n=1 Tax=Christiangramia aquimixticola TaxID=1697558 RepID=UPI003AA8A55A
MKNRLKYLVFLLLAVLLSVSFSVVAQSRDQFEKAQFYTETDTLNYRILYPEDFSEEKKYPLVLVLHGAGERGDNNESQLVHGSDLFLKDENRKNFPAVVVFPQAPQRDYWAKVEVKRDSMPYQFEFKNEEAPTKSLRLVMHLMDSLVSEKYINNHQVYVGGLSMGGMGTYEIIYKKPEMFAAAFAICGGANPEIASVYPEGFPIWIFHGEKDDIVPAALSKEMARAINHYGGNAKLSLYPDDNHNSWDSAFAEPYFLTWLFSQEKE